MHYLPKYYIEGETSSAERGDYFINKREAYEDLLDGGSSNKTVIEQNFETMNRMAANNELLRNIDYDAVLDLDGDFVLRLNYTSFYDRFVVSVK